MKHFFALISLVIFIAITSCSKQTETFTKPSPFAYYPLQTGKKWLYRLDSTVMPPFGTSLIVKSYTAKDSIVAEFTDNQNRISYQVVRYVTDVNQNEPWQYRSTFYVTPLVHSIEVTDDRNLRFINMIEPIEIDKTWKGNAYIDTRSANSLVPYMDNWDYTYTSVNTNFETLKGNLDSCVTILQSDELFPETPFNPNYYQQRNYSVEVYAKGIGLVYKEFLHWTWQVTPPPAKYEDGSYGIKLNLIDYQ